MAHANPIQIQKYLKGVDYPATKNALIENAKKLGADDSVCASLEQLPDTDFQTPAEVSQAFKGPSEDHAERAAPGRGGAAGGADQSGANEFLAQAMDDSMAQTELCLLLLKKTSDEQLRRMAQAMIDDHAGFGQEMEQLALKKHLAIQSAVAPEQGGAIDKMAGLSVGELERRFITQSLRDHENSLKVFRHYAAHEADATLRALAAQGEKLYAKHLKMLKEHEKGPN